MTEFKPMRKWALPLALRTVPDTWPALSKYLFNERMNWIHQEILYYEETLEKGREGEAEGSKDEQSIFKMMDSWVRYKEQSYHSTGWSYIDQQSVSVTHFDNAKHIVQCLAPELVLNKYALKINYAITVTLQSLMVI